MSEMIRKNLIAKTGNETSEWLSLSVHLCDTAEIMKYLIREYVSLSFADSCGMTQQMLENTAVFLAAVHDIGKATVGFQFKISCALPELRSRLEHYGLHFPQSYDVAKLRKTPHGLAGEVILLSLGCPPAIAAVVGAHHGVPCNKEEIRDQALNQPYKDIVGKENYFGTEKKQNQPLLEVAWHRILEDALWKGNFHNVEALPNLNHCAQVLLTGLLIMADWLASNTEYFPLMYWEDEDRKEISSLIRAQNAWESIDFTAMWKSSRLRFPDAEFEDFFGFMPNSVQQAVVQAVESARQPGIMILEAPMGCGKTEAALAAAELMAAKLYKNGLFFGLPTQATANGIFPRIMSWCEQQSVDEYHSIQLRHGGSALNERFQQIQRGIPDGETDSGVIVHKWFCNPKQACLAEFVVATVDHLLMMALKRKHLMLLHLGLSEKVIIIDECHAYDAYMNQYLERVLQWLGAYHTPVILLSATLPAKRRMALVRAYLNQQESDPKMEESCAYPLLTWSDGTKIHQQELPYSGTRRQVRIKSGTLENALPQIISAAANGGCAGVIVNTVKRAQKIAAALRNSSDAEILLYHAQFTHPDRAALEEKLLGRIGKKSEPQQRANLIVVGTQVLEQSLDIDFDLLVTDICPMDLLLQRIGRLHRHSKRDALRPESLRKPLCIVLLDEMETESSGTRQIYGDWLLEETLTHMPEIVTLPDDISVLVQNVYGEEGGNRAYEAHCLRQEKQKSRAKAFLLGNVTQKYIHNMLERYITDSKDAAEAEASVRDGLASIEVLVMQQYTDGTIHFLPHCNGGVAVSIIPAESECRQIAEQKLRLPFVFCRERNIDRTIRELENKCRESVKYWQNSHWLNGQLVLFLDEELKGELCGYLLRYSPDAGLEYENKEE
ncbi:MAG: CRISPR-associated helicase Cas3' [Ruminococcus sp.]|nr:CRISPR-associated helicase Cas3' [Ruminococcus sp.]